MSQYDNLSIEELAKEKKRLEELLDDVRTERELTGRQSGMHISTSVFTNLDREAEKYEKALAEIDAIISMG